MVKDCCNMKRQGKGNIQAQSIIPSSEAPKGNHFYALKARGEREISPDFVTAMLQFFSVIDYALLDLGSTLSFVKPW